MVTVRSNCARPSSGGEAVSFEVLNADGVRADRDGGMVWAWRVSRERQAERREKETKEEKKKKRKTKSP